jgi:hypothetical protein
VSELDISLVLRIAGHILQRLAAVFVDPVGQTGRLLPVLIVGVLLVAVGKTEGVALAHWAWARIRSRREAQP